ncbi:MAG: enoyl-ACP reductase [Spirochaetia bacterium]|nr:enoyl-ACP reductase [Spirochaetota bacterium]MCX8096217.1 enoyl-ACP reductase [Spirochaetota bacterium]MDW8112933.1 enoyl-ACP reductase [Spirochaetia bacterium]
MGIMDGKKGVVFGVANKWSIAWGISKTLHSEGAQILLSYLGEEDKIRELANEINADMFACDVSKDEDITKLFEYVGKKYGKIDFIVHSIAFAPREALQGRYIDTTREAFKIALDISAYSLVKIVKEAENYLNDNGSIITMTYLGSVRAVPNYNVMGVAKAALESSVRYIAYDLGPRGIRCNAISAGPIKTLAARGISGFMSMYEEYPKRSALKRNVDVDEVANTALFLLSDLSSGITGEVIYVDAGYEIMGM